MKSDFLKIKNGPKQDPKQDSVDGYIGPAGRRPARIAFVMYSLDYIIFIACIDICV